MLNVLAGALVGGIFNVACYVIVQLVRRQKIYWREALGSFLGGAVAGALAGASFGTSLMGGGFFKATGFLAADGALGSAAETTVDNVLEKQPALEGVAHDAVIGAIEAPLFFGVTKGIARALPDLGPVLDGSADPDSSRDAPRTVGQRVSTAARRAGRAALSYVKTGPGRRHSVLAVALASQFSGWGGQLLQGVWGYWFHVPDFWGSGGGASSGSRDTAGSKPAAPSPTSGITGSLARAAR
jgi:hypothetical protein